MTTAAHYVGDDGEEVFFSLGNMTGDLTLPMMVWQELGCPKELHVELKAAG